MSDPTPVSALEAIREQAAYWYVLCSDEADDVLWKERYEFCSWLRESPQHVAELLQIARMHKRLSRVRVVIRTIQRVHQNVVSFPQQATYRPQKVSLRSWLQARTARLVKLMPLAAVALIAAILLTHSSRPNFVRTLQTGPHQVDTVVLNDGSIVHLSAHTRIVIDYDADQRLIHLLAGAGVFDVSKDARRPFIVRTYLVDSTALGTRFGVRLDAGVTTTVTEGVVTVARRDGRSTATQPVKLRAGQELHSSEDASSNVGVRDIDAVRTLAWASGWVILQGETLGEGAAAFNTFNATQIVIGSPELAQRPLSYYRFRLHEPEQFARAVADASDVALVIDPNKDQLRLVSEDVVRAPVTPPPDVALSTPHR